ncbi:MAG: flagellar hook-length control protein FliK [Phreatobacter sp.]|nr:flagellar hook-length control protein FliK [Phreatobacter sp.]
MGHFVAASSASSITSTQQGASVPRASQSGRQPVASSSFAEALDAMERQLGEPERANRPARARVAKPAAETAITTAIEPAQAPAERGEQAKPVEKVPGAAEGDPMPKQGDGSADDKLLAKTETPEAAATPQPVAPDPAQPVAPAQAQPAQSPVIAAPAVAPPTTGESAEAPALEAPAIDAAAAVLAGDAGATAEGDAAPVQAAAAGIKPMTTPASGETNGEKNAAIAAASRDAGTDQRAAAARPAADPATAAPEKPAEPARAEAVRPQVAEVATPTAAAAADSAVPDPTPQASAGPAAASPSAFGTEVAQKTAQAPAPGSPVPIHALAVTIAARAGSGATRFDIRLDPAELGRIDVQLTVDRDGAVKSRLVVEKQETLDLLQRDQRNLERALAQAGLQTSEGSLEFSLKDQAGQNPRDRQPEPQASRHQMVVEDPETAAALQASAAIYARAAAMRGGVDIRI